MIEASAPVRICDAGGWTDTWFGGPGRVVNMAVTPGVEVVIRPTGGRHPVVLDVTTFGHRYAVVPGAVRGPRHPLLESAIDAYPPPGDRPVEISVRSAVPAGCGTGTSAAVSIALVAALAEARCEQLPALDLAYAAHRLEVDTLGIQSGIQDQLCAAFGGINDIVVDPYPEAAVHALPAWPELDSQADPRLPGTGPQLVRPAPPGHRRLGPARSGAFARLRDAAAMARDAVVAADLESFGGAMTANTEAQRSLHPELVGPDADRVIGLASALGSLGWKVNGAGGDGGSITIVSATAADKEIVERRIGLLDPRYRVLPVRLDERGCQVEGTL